MSLAEGPFLRIDFTDSFTQEEIQYTFKNPVAVLVAHQYDELTGALQSLQDYLQKGYYAAGYLTYEAGAFFLPKPPLGFSVVRENSPLLWFGIFTIPDKSQKIPEDEEYYLSSGLDSIDFDEYRKSVLKIQSEIEAGNVYQVNYTFSKRYRYLGSPQGLYGKLIRNQGSLYNALVYDGSRHILSISPEIFFQKKSDRLRMKPMKGTRRRSHNENTDRILQKELAASSKDRAENNMIVDLLRNDMGKICRPGSVSVVKRWEVETYKTVYQMTSTIDGQVNAQVSVYDLFSSLFPSGSITGAPKIDAMRYITGLENPRGIYTGTIGFFSPNGDSIFNISIRTLELKETLISMGIGSGIVHDSIVQNEFEECHSKSRFLDDLSKKSPEIIETFRCSHGVFYFLNEHLDRAEKTAKALALAFDRKKVLEELKKLPKSTVAMRIRLSVKDGVVELHNRPLENTKNCFFTLAKETIRRQNTSLLFKTSLRGLFDKKYKEALEKELDDIVFLNEEGHVTQGCIHNIFIKIDGIWKTPPLSDGLLPGIMRQKLIFRLSAKEESLRREDLVNAGQIILCNSLRGIRRAKFIQD